MLNIWLPETHREEYEHRAALQCAAFAALLEEIDPRLELIWVKENATSFPVPGRWYIVRRNEHAHDTFWVVQDEHGRYCEPDDRHLAALKARDTHAHPDVYRRHRMKVEEEERHRQWVNDERRREFREKLDERIAHNEDTSVSVPKEVAA